ncbi:MAG: hypothetical protein HDR36_09870 [Treponema sp.]|nr:hypothetical protein [Treponema sp.]
MKNNHEKNVLKKSAKESLKIACDGIGSAVLGPVWEVKNFIKNCYGTYKELSFDEFIKSMYGQFESRQATVEDINRYIEELRKSNANQYISNIIDSLFFSKCILASQILGLITAKYLIDGDLDYCDLFLISALKDLYDEDIRNFMNLYHKLSTAKNGLATLSNYSDKERVLLDKLQNLNILGRDRATNRLCGSTLPLYFERTDVSIRLAEYYNLLASTYD